MIATTLAPAVVQGAGSMLLVIVGLGTILLLRIAMCKRPPLA